MNGGGVNHVLEWGGVRPVTAMVQQLKRNKTQKICILFEGSILNDNDEGRPKTIPCG